MKIQPVILCGGSGSRLWPLSRAGFPKQFLILSGSDSLFQQTVARINGLASEEIQVAETLVVTNEAHRFLALDQIREMKSISAKLLLEPIARNTAPALTIAALQIIESQGDAIMVVTPADQIILNASAFNASLQKAVKVASSGAIAILGVSPDRPETGYGYIRHAMDKGESTEFSVAEFAEKPDLQTAQKYIESGEYLWNSGMFILKASTWLAAIRKFRPDIAEATEQAWSKKTEDLPFIRPDREIFAKIPGDSIDYAVIERCPAAEFPLKVIELESGWNDLGAWEAVWQVSEHDASGNATRGDTLISDTHNSLVYATSRLVSTMGVNNLLIVETADAVLVAERGHSQEIKQIVTTLEQQSREEHILHRKVHRPWGWYDSIEEESCFKVKRIQVKPNASLSLQKHQHRAEHWIVVKGTALVTCGENTLKLTENQSTYIPQGEVHRLANPGPDVLELIEVQSGSYLGEDDIVRFEDTYGRAEGQA